MLDKHSIGSIWRKWDLHVHTASSFDYKYKNEDADDKLVEAWREHNIEAVAITDHFLIDAARIKSLRTKAPDITIFPGVELRTDKGASNVHVIIIFSENKDLDLLEQDFNSIMIREKAIHAENPEKIFWDFKQIVEFATKRDGILTIHSGQKSNGVDSEITNALPINQSIKEDYAEYIDFFEVGKLKDIEDYRKKVLPDIGDKPLIICSDNHDPREYYTKANLWIKADKTFEGLMQCIYQPLQRVFVGDVPPKLDKFSRNKRTYIKKISIKNTDETSSEKWFDDDVELNPGLVAIIGNKGSGKSALTDIIGRLCNCSTINDYASFLNEDRFKKAPQMYANRYNGKLIWHDEAETDKIILGSDVLSGSVQTAQYLPQKFIETICTDLNAGFQDEINKVIYSYFDEAKREGTNNLKELMERESSEYKRNINTLRAELDKLNKKSIDLEDRKTKEHHETVKGYLTKLRSDLDRHRKSKPTKILKPEESEAGKRIQAIEIEIEAKQKEISEGKRKVSLIDRTIQQLKKIIEDENRVIDQIKGINEEIDSLSDYLISNKDSLKIENNISINELNSEYKKLNTMKEKVIETLGHEVIFEENTLFRDLHDLLDKKAELISKSDTKMRQYQKFLTDEAEWTKTEEQIIGSAEKEGSMKYYEKELTYIENQLNQDYEVLINHKKDKIKQLFEEKVKIVQVYNQLYKSVETALSKVMDGIDEKIEFSAELVVNPNHLSDDLLKNINKQYAGIFYGKTQAYKRMNELINSTDFNNFDSLLQLIQDVLQCRSEDEEHFSQKVRNRIEFYNVLMSLDYIDVEFSLKVGGKNLKELSPGERGIVLLIFYLVLSKNEEPIIIDQPEDNLDNQSVYKKLVPCICAAKDKRQVIIVTHNPNIAVACDAEQIVHSTISKNKNEIRYESGSIENPYFKGNIINILEGTMPAFRLRRLKYS